jgi:hypothetical protein
MNFTGFYVFENYTDRVTTKEWKEILLKGYDKIIVKGRMRTLKSRSLGCGVREVYLEPME